MGRVIPVIGAEIPPPVITLDSTYAAVGVSVPVGALDRWRAYRDTGAAARREVPVFGDSTTWGAESFYSWVQRVRDRAVAAGLADGGKGFVVADGDIVYDPPEVNAVVSSTFTGSDHGGNDTVAGGYIGSAVAGETATFQFRASSCRIWYVRRPQAGTFSYLVDGEPAVTVDANKAGNPLDAFAWVTGYDPAVAHQLVVTNGSGTCHVAVAPVNDNGVAVQKIARSGHGFIGGFHGPTGSSGHVLDRHAATRYQAHFGLTPTHLQDPLSPRSSDDYIAHNITDVSYATPINPVLAILHLGFNDLSAVTNTSEEWWFIEGVRKFAAACRTAECDGIVASGQLPLNAKWPTWGAHMFRSMRHYALINDLAFVDLFVPLGFGESLEWTGGSGNPHRSKAEHVAQADWLWDNVLSI